MLELLSFFFLTSLEAIAEAFAQKSVEGPWTYRYRRRRHPSNIVPSSSGSLPCRSVLPGTSLSLPVNVVDTRPAASAASQ